MLPFLGKNVHTAQAQYLSSSLSPFTHLGDDSRDCYLELEWIWAWNLVDECLPWACRFIPLLNHQLSRATPNRQAIFIK